MITDPRRPAAALARLALMLMLAATAARGAAAQETAQQTARETVSILYLSRAEDPAYRPARGYAGFALRERRPPVEGARLAMRESRIRGRALGLTFELEERELAPAEDVAAVISALGPRVAILDLPLADMLAAVAAAEGRADLLFFNIRHGDDRLRAEDCAASLLHAFPSRAMLADAMAQFLAFRRWPRVLILQGPLPEDAEVSAAMQRSAVKFGLDVVAVKPFELSNDPRHRDENNIALLTGVGAPDYDVVFLADGFGEFGRYAPYATFQPRPVLGSEGLGAVAWSWSWERNGAPQLNQRFDKLAGRRMVSEDWAAWAAARAVVEAISRTRETAPARLRALMLSEDFSLDLYKGAPGSFRAWDGQLRQPILLATHNAVIARAPLEGFLHRTNELDTLGPDREETACRRFTSAN